MRNGLYFGFASIAIREAGLVRGVADVTGGLTLDLSAPIVKTMGGASNFPVAARAGRGESELSVTLNHRPEWVDDLLNEGTRDVIAAGDASASAVSNVKGASLAAKLAAAVKAGASPKVGLYQLVQTAATKLKGQVVGPAGVYEIPETTFVANAAKELPGTGIELTASQLAFANDTVVNFEVLPAHGGIVKISIPQVRKGKEYEVLAYSAAGGSDDAIEKFVIPQAVFSGSPTKLTDNEPGSNGVEMTGAAIAPEDGGAIYRREIIKKA